MPRRECRNALVIAVAPLAVTTAVAYAQLDIPVPLDLPSVLYPRYPVQPLQLVDTHSSVRSIELTPPVCA